MLIPTATEDNFRKEATVIITINYGRNSVTLKR